MPLRKPPISYSGISLLPSRLLLLLSGLLSYLPGRAQTCSGTDAYGQAAQPGLVAEYYKGYIADQAALFINNAAFPLKSTQNPVYIERVESTAPAYTSNGSWSSSGLNLFTAGVATGSNSVPSQFSARYRGQLYIETAGSYTFYLYSDDGSYLAIDADASQQTPSSYLINNGGGHGAKTVTGTLTLSVGWHSLVVLYGNGTGGGVLNLQYSATDLGVTKQTIPSTKLCTGLVSVPTGLAYASASSTVIVGSATSSGAPSVYAGNQAIAGYAITDPSSLPAGITIDATTGVLTADATVPSGTYPVSVSATNTTTSATTTSGTAAFPAVYTFQITQPLPITLVRFGAQAQGTVVQLSWETASELNSAVFELERSADGVAFGPVGQVAAAGNSVTTQHYQAVDAVPLPGLSYYRLRQVDRDGSSHYSLIAAVQRSAQGAAPALTLAPNPSAGHVLVHLVQAWAQPAWLQVLDALGREVYRQALPAETTQAPALDLSALPAGVYVVRIIAATGVATQHLVRQ